MRVFVVGTGRCGSVTFARACEHMTNFTTGHEEVFCKPDKLVWPDQHVAVGPMWPLVPLLRRAWPDLVLVHLIRTDVAEFIESYMTLEGSRGPTIDVWADLYVGAPISDAERRGRCLLFHASTNELIRALGPDLTVRLEHGRDDFARFWDHVGARGDRDGALAEWSVKHNARDNREPPR